MSIEAVNWALNVDGIESASERMVLVGLANHASKEGTDAFPSRKTLADYACLTERHVVRVLQALQSRGLIVEGDPRLRDVKIARGDRRPNVWDLQMSRGDIRSPRDGERGDIHAERGDIGNMNGVTPMSPEPSLNRPTEPEPLTVMSTDVDDLGFDQVWDIYPRRNGRKVDKGKARDRWCKLTVAHRRECWRAVKNYAAACNGDETIAKDMHRFLAGGYWRDWLEEPSARPVVIDRFFGGVPQ